MSEYDPSKRPRLINPAILWAIGIAGVAALGLTFHSMDRATAVLAHRAPDELSIRYLNLVVRMHPEDTALRMMLARQQQTVGQLEQAAQTLAPLLQATPANDEVVSLGIEIDYARANALQPADPNRPPIIEALLKRIGAIHDQVRNPATLKNLARISLEQNHPELAGTIYQELTQADPTQALQWRQEAARWFTASGDNLKAAQLLDQAAQQTTDPEQFRNLAMHALDLYQAGMAFDLALQRAEAYRQKLPEDSQFIVRAIAIALAANQPERARDFGRERVKLQPNDRQNWEDQIERELAVSDYAGALAAAKQWAKLDPACTTCLQKTASLAEMAGEKREALALWRSMVQAGDHGKPLQESLRLARDTRQDGLWRELMSIRLQEQVLSKEDYFAAEAVYKRSSTASEWVAFLHQAIERNPNQLFLWEGLINTLQKNGQSDALIATLDAMEKRFGGNADAVMRSAHLLASMGKKDAALGRLRVASSRFDAHSSEFWKLYGDLAWEQDSNQEASKAYGVLVEAGSADALAFERLAYLARKSGNMSEAIGYAEQGWRAKAEPRLLILAMDSALQARQWDKLSGLLDAAAPHQAVLVQNESFWTIKAGFEAHQGDIPKAIASYEKLLALKPDSASARAGLLWLLIDQQRKPELEKYLAKWADGASSQAPLADAFGAAYLRLGRYHDAESWFERRKSAHKQDPMWLLQYAEVLQQTGQIEPAWKLRDYVLQHFRNALAAHAKTDKQSAMAYLRLVNEKQGAADRFRAFQTLASMNTYNGKAAASGLTTNTHE